MAYDPNQQYQQPPQYQQPGYQQPGYQQPGYPPPGYQQPVAQSPMVQQLGPSSIGLEPNLAAAISYFWIVGLIFFLIEKKNRFVRFHAMQALLWGLAFWVVAIILGFLPYVYLLGDLVWIAWVIGSVYSAVQAYGGKWFKLPVVGDIAYKNAMAWVPPEGGAPPMGGGMPPYQNTQYPQQPGGYTQQPGQYPPPPPTYPQQ
ncbi:MAG TPA: DUF4870 domain-containing protein [Ktedonobacterales bacterium]